MLRLDTQSKEFIVSSLLIMQAEQVPNFHCNCNFRHEIVIALLICQGVRPDYSNGAITTTTT